MRTVLDALWDLVWSGEVTNDSPAALRAFLSASGGRRRDRRRPLGSFQSRRPLPPSAVGRWSRLRRPKGAAGPTATEMLAARAAQLLARHGLVTREAVASEGVPGGFAGLYPVLKALEESGRARRGYFVAGLGGSQFADAGAADRLRTQIESPAESFAVVLAAADPANPYGAALPWPQSPRARLARAAGSHVVLVDGALAAFLPRGERDLATFLPPDEPGRSAVARAVAGALARWTRATGRLGVGWDSVDETPVRESPLAPFLAEVGFVPSGGGVRMRG